MGFNKKVLSKAVSELGKAKAPAKPRDIITDPAGQWKYPGQKTRIPGSSITMQGVDYPVWAQPNVGPGSMMQPGQDYEFPNADYVDETPIGRKGGTLKSKRYSSNISATNKLFTKNKLFQNKKSKIFDPNAKFKSGGSKLGPINLNPNPLSHYELNYGFNLPTKEDGGENEDEYMDLTDEEIQAYRDAGYEVDEEPEYEIGGYVQHELVKAQKGKTVIHTDRDKYNKAFTAESDSLSFYNSGINNVIKADKTKKTPKNQTINPSTKKYESYNTSLKNLKDKDKQFGIKLSDQDYMDYLNIGSFSDKTKKLNKPVGFVTYDNGLHRVGQYKKPVIHNVYQQPESPSTHFEKQKTDDSIITDTDIVPEGYKRIGSNYVASRDEKTGKVTEKEKFMHELIPQLATKPMQQFITPEQTIIPGKQQIKPFQYKWREWKPAVYEGKNLEMPEGSTQADVEKKIRQLQRDEFTRKTLEYQEQQRGINKPVAQLRKDGGALDSYQKKGEVKTFKRDIRDQDAQSNTGWSSAPVEKKKVQPTAKQKQIQKSFDKNFKVTDKSKYEKTEDKIASEQQKLKDFGKENGIPVTNADLENVANQQWSFAGVGPQKQPDMMQATPEQSNSNRAWEYMTNPMTAAEYAISGGGAENMPHNINEMRMAGFDPGVVQGRNLVGNTLNSSLNLLDAGDKVARNAYRGKYGDAALEALRFAPGSGLLDDAVKLGIKPGAKYLSKTLGTETGLVPLQTQRLNKIANITNNANSTTKGTDYIWKNVNKNVAGELPEGITKQHIADVLESKVSWIESPEYAKRRMATTGETLEEVAKDVQKLKTRYENTKIHFKPIKEKEKAAGFYQSIPFQPSKDMIVVDPARSTSLEDMLGTLDHEIDHALSPAQKNNKLYNNYPFMPTDMGDAHRAALKKSPQSAFSKFIKGDKSKVIPYLEQAPEQQVRFNRLNQKIREDLNLTRNEGELTTTQFDEWVNKQKENNFESLDEGHNDVVDLLLNKSKSMDRPAILKILNKAWSIAPVVGAAGVIGAGALQQKRFGGEEAWEDELDDREIALLRRGGYVVEELD